MKHCLSKKLHLQNGMPGIIKGFKKPELLFLLIVLMVSVPDLAWQFANTRTKGTRPGKKAVNNQKSISISSLQLLLNN